METNNIDSKFKNIISENQDFYSCDADAAKYNVWAGISAKKKRKTGAFLIYSLSAACISLLVLSTILGISLLNNKNYVQQTPLKLETAKQLDQCFIRAQPVYIIDTIQLTDTIILRDIETIYEIVEIIKNIIDTVFINQIEYIDVVAPIDNYIVEENIQTPENSNSGNNPSSTEILINNSDSEAKNQKPKAKFRFGIGKNQNSNGSLAITTNL